MPTTNLSKDDVLGLVRKEFDRKLQKLCDEYGIDPKDVQSSKEEDSEDDDSEDKPKEGSDKLDLARISPGIRIQHSDSKLEYTVVSLNLHTGMIGLRTPDGQIFTVTADELESEYILD